jgi:hypothetical protein
MAGTVIAAARQFGSDRGYTGHVSDIIDATVLTQSEQMSRETRVLHFLHFFAYWPPAHQLQSIGNSPTGQGRAGFVEREQRTIPLGFHGLVRFGGGELDRIEQ